MNKIKENNQNKVTEKEFSKLTTQTQHHNQ